MSNQTGTTLVSFGCNDDGQLGRHPLEEENSSISYLLPAAIESLRNVSIRTVSCGSRHTLILTEDGKVYSFGWGKMGQLGHGTNEPEFEPKLIQFFHDRKLVIKAISSGGCHSAAVTEDGDLYMWGEAHWGQLGLDSELEKGQNQYLPALCSVIFPPDSDDKVLTVSCGGAHTAALTEQGHIYTWGRGDNGQLGTGKSWLETEAPGMLGVPKPHQIAPESFCNDKIKSIACGAFHTAAITEAGAVYTWGKEDYGMLGLGHTPDVHNPLQVQFPNHMVAQQVSCGGWHTVVVMESGECYAFGRGEYGRLGLGDTKSHARPERVEALKKERIVQASCGGTHSLFLTESGRVYSTGRQDHGRLGSIQETKSAFPGVIEGLNGPAVQIACGGAHSIIVLKA